MHAKLEMQQAEIKIEYVVVDKNDRYLSVSAGSRAHRRNIRYFVIYTTYKPT